MSGWADRVRGVFSLDPGEEVSPWALIPSGMVCALLLVSGVWAGTRLGSSPSAAASTYEIVRSGRVVTVHGVEKVSLPAQTVTRDGRTIQLAARLLTLTQSHTATRTQPAHTVVRSVTLPAVTITGPTTSQTSTVTEPGTTVSVTVTVTQTGSTTTVTTTATTTT
jgi:hypothetical protein